MQGKGSIAQQNLVGMWCLFPCVASRFGLLTVHLIRRLPLYVRVRLPRVSGDLTPLERTLNGIKVVHPVRVIPPLTRTGKKHELDQLQHASGMMHGPPKQGVAKSNEVKRRSTVEAIAAALNGEEQEESAQAASGGGGAGGRDGVDVAAEGDQRQRLPMEGFGGKRLPLGPTASAVAGVLRGI